ncbi:MAG: hypothetical protein AB9869_12365 [Verrucomicrobiia bacterium]
MQTRFRASTSALAVMLFVTVGCTTAHRDVRVSTLETPIKIQFAESASILLASGQVIEPPRCCPPLELRTANGQVVQEFDVTAGPQRLVAPSGTYSLVGHDPGGEDRVVQIKVTEK